MKESHTSLIETSTKFLGAVGIIATVIQVVLKNFWLATGAGVATAILVTIALCQQQKLSRAKALTIWETAGLLFLLGLLLLPPTPAIKVVNPQGAPYRQQTLRIQDAHGENHEVLTNQSGMFRLPRMPSGEFWVFFGDTTIFRGNAPPPWNLPQRVSRIQIVEISHVPEPTPLPPTPIPTATPTWTPSPSPSPLPSATPTPTFTPSPTPTPSNPLIEVFPQGKGAKEFSFPTPSRSDIHGIFLASDLCAHSGVYGLLLVYTTPHKTYAGWGLSWESAEYALNLSEYDTITLYAKSLEGTGRFQVGIKDTNANEFKAEIQLVTRDWEVVQIPLRKAIQAGVNLQQIENINFGFNDSHGKGGMLCIDDLTWK